MQAEILNKPTFANLRVRLEPGESILAEADAMASMSASTEITTRFNGGLVGGLLRRVFGRESLFINEFHSSQGSELILTQSVPGDIEHIELDGNSLFLQPGAFIACHPDVELGVGWAGFASFIGREGLFRLKVSGSGSVWFGAYGGLFTRDIDEEWIVDTGHLVAYEPTVSLSVGLSGGIFSSFFSGEGLVTRLRGPGRVYLQSRSLEGLTSWTNSYL